MMVVDSSRFLQRPSTGDCNRKRCLGCYIPLRLQDGSIKNNICSVLACAPIPTVPPRPTQPGHDSPYPLYYSPLDFRFNSPVGVRGQHLADMVELAEIDRGTRTIKVKCSLPAFSRPPARIRILAHKSKTQTER